MESLSTKEYRNEFVTNFDGDESGSLLSRQTPGKLYSKAIPTPVKAPALLAWSEGLADELGIKKPTDQKDINILGGNLITSSMSPYAACYAGHQFGNWAGQLGDGRAITLGEWQNGSNQSWEMQLKGAGPTAYSRRADGRAVVRSSLREYLMSEAMYHLGVPTTRALSLVGTGDDVMRDMFYDGHADYEPGAIVMRVAPSFLRFGNFEMLAARDEVENLTKLVKWTIEKFYPHIAGKDKIIRWFKEVVARTATLMVEWSRVGFVHGVMNTDNMSVLGLTIDYGPYSFVDEYDPDFTPNTTDLPGKRYAFGRQASVAKWNLGCLGGAIAPLFANTDELVAALDEYDEIYLKKFYTMMGNKLGLDKVRVPDVDLIKDFEKMLSTLKPDMTIFYRRLMEIPSSVENVEEVISHFTDSFYTAPDAFKAESLFHLMDSYQLRLKANTGSREESLMRMKAANPYFIPRNYLLHQAIEALGNGDNDLFIKLQQAIKEPCSDKYAEFFAKRPNWANAKAGCSMLSCSS